MANTTVSGAKAIHGQNPQVGGLLLCKIPVEFIRAVPD